MKLLYKKPHKIAYLTASNPLDKRSWSGIHYRMFTALEEQFEVVVPLGPVLTNKKLKKLLKIINKLHVVFFGKKYNKQHNSVLGRFYAREFQTRLKSKSIDVIVAPAASTELSFLKTDIPIVYISDTSFAQIQGYYNTYSGYSKISNTIANKIEQQAISKASALIYSSDWAANYVKNNYVIDSKLINVIPFGANIDGVPEILKQSKTFEGTLNLLFLGKQWERKGGDIVLKATRLLKSKGFNVTLTICGCVPPTPINEDYIEVYKFLNKNNEEEYVQFLNIMANSHLLFLPTKADCTPIVFCEANAFGIPILSRDTGGVSSIVKNNINGVLLSESAQAEEYCLKMEELISQPNKLLKMSKNGRRLYEDELNWSSWGDSMQEIILKITKYNNDIKEG